MRVLATFAAVLLVAPACGNRREALTVYSGRTENLVGPLLEKFSKEKNIPINVRYGDSADLALLIGEEGENSPADVFFSQSPGAVGLLAGRNLLAKIGAAQLE
ncbi:MAG: substrate-binding domain-containing protein, partial [Actinomycetota bacterium]